MYSRKFIIKFNAKCMTGNKHPTPTIDNDCYAKMVGVFTDYHRDICVFFQNSDFYVLIMYPYY